MCKGVIVLGINKNTGTALKFGLSPMTYPGSFEMCKGSIGDRTIALFVFTKVLLSVTNGYFAVILHISGKAS